MAANKSLNGYPIRGAMGSRAAGCLIHPGPADYTPVDTGTPVADGDSIEAKAFGLSSIEGMTGGLSDDGQYEAVPILENTGEQSAGQTLVRLMWRTAATGAEVALHTNLSGRKVRLFAFGL